MKRYAKHPDANRKGFYVIEHMPTGKLWTGIAKKSMKLDLDSLFVQLETGQFENLEFQKLFDKEPNFKVHLHAVTHIDDAKLRERTFRGCRAPYLLINKSDTRERKRRSERVLTSMLD